MSRRDSSKRTQLPSEANFDPYRGNLDAQSAWKDFGGLTLDQANAKFRECPFTYQEAFMWMGTKAFAYYFPVIESFLREADGADPLDDRQSWILAQAVLTQLKTMDSKGRSVLATRIGALAQFVRQNLALFSPEERAQSRLDAAWRDVEIALGEEAS